MIVVLAATGELGRLVIDRLLGHVPPGEVVAAVRHPDRAGHVAARGVTVRHADYDDPSSMRSAFAGADRLLFISAPMDARDRVVRHRSVVDAAREAEVGTIVYTSGLGADVSEDGLLGEHAATERAIVGSGLSATILRHPIYSDFFFHPGLREAMETGELTSSSAGRGLNTALRADLAEAAATVLTTDGHAGQVYDFTGPLWTYAQLATVLSSLAGRPVVSREQDEDEGVMTMIGAAVRHGAFERQTGDLDAVLGHPATSLEDAVAGAVRTSG
jgi:NAD(P)H dehydrogenase (quinone)